MVRLTQQAAVDFMVSYGIALLMLSVAMYVILSLGIFGGSLAPSSCYSSPAFACDDAAFNYNGVLTIVLTQNVGGTINITAAACSGAINATGNAPQFGNTKVQSNSIVPQYYPTNELAYGLNVYSGAPFQLLVYCYTNGGIAQQNLGTVFTGYLWLNYTYIGLPTTVHTVNRVVEFSEKVT